ncbi:peptide chain release factor 1 [Candidatus Dependentiae bacterium]|nr:MAG: peptide chain release factor 1 [Candidatus Dependentiae bacterium]
MTKVSWEAIKQRYEDLNSQLAEPALTGTARHQFQKEHAYLSAILKKKTELDELDKKIIEAKEAAAESEDAAFVQLCKEEQQALEKQREHLEKELNNLLFPPDELDNRSVYLEIRAGAGGQEAALFVADMLKMYTNYALSKGWHVSVESSSATDLGGFREVILFIKGKNVYGHLNQESGVHRVQRVPATETSGRIHTSTATVAVLPEAKDVDLSVDPNDLRIDVFRASGAGGQHVNTTDSAVRITHIPTGIVASCQDERSQHKNKAKAMKILESRLLAAKLEQEKAERRKQRKEMVGKGMRAEKVRTYNFPQNRITDHQINLTLKNLDVVLAGQLDEIIQALYEKKRQERQKHPFIS